MHHVIYKTTDPNTGEFYIGKHSTSDLDDGYQGSGTWVRTAKKANRVLVTEIIAHCNSEHEVFSLEETIVSEAMHDPLCRNIAPGGIAPPKRYGPRSPEERRKLSESRKGIVFSDSHIAAIRASRTDMNGERNPFFGRSHSVETRDKIREGLRKYREETGWMPKPKKQYYVKKSPEIVKQNRSRARLGKLHPEETKRKMSSSQKRAWEHRPPLSTATCPHCGKEGNQVVMHRWHFDRCKSKL